MSGQRDGRLLTKKPVYEGRTVRLFLERVALPNGSVAELEVVHHPGAACVLPILASGEVVLVRQWRHAAGAWLLEAPAGKLDAGEPPESCARRELEEEAGLVAGELVSLGTVLMTPGFCDERIHLFAAPSPSEGVARLEHDEVLSTERHAPEDVVRMAAAGGIDDAKTLAVISRARWRGLI